MSELDGRRRSIRTIHLMNTVIAEVVPVRHRDDSSDLPPPRQRGLPEKAGTVANPEVRSPEFHLPRPGRLSPHQESPFS